MGGFLAYAELRLDVARAVIQCYALHWVHVATSIAPAVLRVSGLVNINRTRRVPGPV